MKHFRYLSYLIRHKWFVFVAGLKVKASLWRLLKHDWSKFLPSEWFPYVESFYGGHKYSERPPEVVEAFDTAWLHHQNRNDHHWQYWLLTNDKQKPRLRLHSDDTDINTVFLRVMEKEREVARLHIPIMDAYRAIDQAWREGEFLVGGFNRQPVALAMPEAAIREMVADWAGAGRVITGKWEVVDWYRKNRDNIVLHPDTRSRVEELLARHFPSA